MGPAEVAASAHRLARAEARAHANAARPRRGPGLNARVRVARSASARVAGSWTSPTWPARTSTSTSTIRRRVVPATRPSLPPLPTWPTRRRTTTPDAISVEYLIRHYDLEE